MSGKHLRAQDRSNYIDIQKSGFVVRKHTPINRVLQLLKAIAVCVLVLAIMRYYNSPVGLLMCLGGGFLTLFLGSQLEAMQKNQHSTEFVNAIFSSALGKKYLFCLAARDDGEIIYVNYPFQTLFPDFIAQDKLDLSTLLRMQNVSSSDSDKVMALLANTAEGNATITMDIGSTNASKPVTLSIEPIDRPKGFVIIRGK